ncbi:MAG TPA: hypothetical protein VF573_14440 [Paraburkholderia sp.]|uniref:hypothetical protein n=1 Tax=Paraburkholderia sp. TaxID=1926495 RepID=UPI002ED617C1
MRRIDAAEHAKLALARASKLHVKQKGPDNPSDPASVQAHQKELDKIDIDILAAKLRISDDDPEGQQV